MNNVRQKFYIALAVLTVVVVGTFYGVWIVLSGQIEDAQSSYAANQKEVRELEKKLEVRSDLKKELEDIEGDIDKINSLFLEQKDTLKPIEEFENIATTTQVTYELDSISRKEDDSGNVKEMDFNVNLEGEFANILQFFRRVEDTPFITTVTQLSAESSQDASLLSVNAVIKVYLR